jgi:hypothetical protein
VAVLYIAVNIVNATEQEDYEKDSFPGGPQNLGQRLCLCDEVGMGGSHRLSILANVLSSQNVEYDAYDPFEMVGTLSLYTYLDANLEQNPAKRVTGQSISLWQPNGN